MRRPLEQLPERSDTQLRADMGSEDNPKPPAAEAAEAEPGAAGRKKRKAGTKKRAGTKWLNYLLALGCLASLLPLWFEHRSLQPAACTPRAHCVHSGSSEAARARVSRGDS